MELFEGYSWLSECGGALEVNSYMEHASMEEGYTLVWDGGNTMVQNEEEVICNVESDCAILPQQSEEFDGMCEEIVIQEEADDSCAHHELVDEEVVVEGDEQSDGPNIMYVTEDDMMVVQQSSEIPFEETNFVVTREEVITDNWGEDCSEIIVGSEEHVEEQAETENLEIPLPTAQDEYTAARPYPCDFCSRRFSKKANLQNHMISHQQDRPHCCNLCGISYIRKYDLMNHLKTHAYSPENNMIDEEGAGMTEYDGDRTTIKHIKFINRRKNKLKTRDEDEDENNYAIPSSSRSYGYVEEDVKLMESMEGDSKHFGSYLSADNESGEPKFPITDSRKPFVCQECGVSFAREKALASHSRVHGGDSPFECRTCGEVFWDITQMREHIRVQHGGVEQDFEEDDDEDYSAAEEDAKFGQFFCTTCGMAFHRQDNLKRHQRTHVKDEMNRENSFGHTCNVCGETFPEALELLAHAEVHARGWEHRCMICGEVFIDDQTVAAHVMSKHKNLPPNTCMMCGRTCKDRRTLLKHSLEHSREKSFGCSKCDKTFYNKARLKRHMISHRNKVVTCEECGENFPDGRSLMNHRHSHSSISGRHFPCRECGKTFGSRSSQQIHIRIHTGERPYGCRFCWKAFADGGTLRKHERIHTGEKPYACAVCPRAFNQRVVLREHIRSHHSAPDVNLNHTVTPYSCSVCSDMFATSQDLIVHLIHHCDLNTAMKRQPQVGPRKYKRRRKLKPHEIEMMSAQNEEELTDSETDYRRRVLKKQKRTPPKPPVEETYADVYNNFTSSIENMDTIVNSSPSTSVKISKLKRKLKTDTSPIVPSRPKMIHTQKTRVPVDSIDGTKVRHKMKTLVTHTQPTELRSATGERIRPRTKNVSYHVYQGEKLPLATFPEDDTVQAVNNLIASEEAELQNHQTDYGIDAHMDIHTQNGMIEENPPDIASEQTVESAVEEEPTPDSIIKVNTSEPKKSTYSLRPGRTIIGPGDKVVRLVKSGMVVSKTKKIKEEIEEPEEVRPFIDNTPEDNTQLDFQETVLNIKQECTLDPLQELAEISMQIAQNIFKCDMCSDIFSDREQLLEHVSIHI